MIQRPLKILFALQYYVPHRTGLTIHVQRVAEGLAQRGHEVTVLTARYSPSLPRDETVNGVRVIRLWAPLRVSRGMVMPAYLWAAWGLVAKHDVISIHTPMLETALFGILARVMRKGLVITHHGDLVLPKGILNRIISWMTFQFYLVAGRSAHRILAYSHDYADHSYYIAPFRDKTSAVYPPIKVNRPNASGAKKLRAEWLSDAGPSARLIAYTGRFVEEKRPDVLINALSAIHQRYPGSRIVFAGEYNIRYEHFYERHRELVKQYADHLIFLGLVTDDQVIADYYAACDVLALPSDTECFALVQVEAMRCGTPVVSTDIPGAREVVRVTGMGEVVPAGNAPAMGKAICRVFDNPNHYKKSAATIEALFNYDETVSRYEKHLQAAFKAAGTSV